MKMQRNHLTCNQSWFYVQRIYQWPYVTQVDWDKWVDEDEEDEAADKDMGFDMSQFQNFSNFGDMGGMSGMTRTAVSLTSL